MCLECPTPKLVCPTVSLECPTPASLKGPTPLSQSLPGVPNPRVSLECPTPGSPWSGVRGLLWSLGLGFRVSGLGFRVSGLYKVSDEDRPALRVPA